MLLSGASSGTAKAVLNHMLRVVGPGGSYHGWPRVVCGGSWDEGNPFRLRPFFCHCEVVSE